MMYKVLFENQIARISVANTGVQWTVNLNGLVTRSLSFKQILCAYVESKETQHYAAVYYVNVIHNENKTVVLRKASVRFLSTEDIVNEITQNIMKTLDTQECRRPKRLLMFLNPKAGKQNGVATYTRVIQPLFNLAKVKADTIVTKHAQHADEVLRTYDMSTVDGVVVMGGDGTYDLVFNSYMKRLVDKAGLDNDNPELKPIKPNIAFGVIPAGSACSLAYLANSTADLETCVITIILGATLPADLNVIRHKETGDLLRYSMYCLQTGCTLNAFSMVDQLRTLKTARYAFIPFAVWLMFKTLKVEVEYHDVPQTFSARLHKNGSGPKNDTIHLKNMKIPDWKCIEGKTSCIDVIPEHALRYCTFVSFSEYRKPVVSSGRYRLIFYKALTFRDMFLCYKFIVGNQNENSQEIGHNLIPREYAEHITTDEIRLTTLKNKTTSFPAYVAGESIDATTISMKIFKEVFPLYVIDDDLVRCNEKFLW